VRGGTAFLGEIMPNILTANVKIMLSYDYNHFEVALSAECSDMLDVNNLRKRAQRLADEAVRQYKVSKEMASKRSVLENEFRRLKDEINFINKKPQSDWTAEEKAKVKALNDKLYWEAHQYNYDDADQLPF
jgi:hypothetical protein